MFMVIIRIKVRQILFQHIRRYFSLLLGQHQHFVAAEFDGAGFVGADMAGLGRNYPLIIAEHGRDDHGICLGTAHQKLHISSFAAACSSDLILCPAAVFVKAVARQRLHVCTDKTV